MARPTHLKWQHTYTEVQTRSGSNNETIISRFATFSSLLYHFQYFYYFFGHFHSLRYCSKHSTMNASHTREDYVVCIVQHIECFAFIKFNTVKCSKNLFPLLFLVPSGFFPFRLSFFITVIMLFVTLCNWLQKASSINFDSGHKCENVNRHFDFNETCSLSLCLITASACACVLFVCVHRNLLKSSVK